MKPHARAFALRTVTGAWTGYRLPHTLMHLHVMCMTPGRMKTGTNMARLCTAASLLPAADAHVPLPPRRCGISRDSTGYLQ